MCSGTIFRTKKYLREDELFNLLGCNLGNYAFTQEDQLGNFNINKIY
jgi:hypothetical protein